MECKSGEKWGKGSYKCCECGCIQELKDNDEILKNCSCGNNTFNIRLNINRSKVGFKIKLDEIVCILEGSIFMCDKLNQLAFYNVMAVQLRILLCDNKEIIKSKLQNPMLHQCSSEVFDDKNGTKMVLSNNLFDESQPKISLEEWLSQPIAWSENWDCITIKEVIKAYADKNGGAHVDSTMSEKAFFAINVLGKAYLLQIASYIIELLGYDFNDDIKKYFTI